MALTPPWQTGNPGNYKNSNLWDTPWAQQALNNKSMSSYANQMGGYAKDYLSGNSPLGRMADTYGAQAGNYFSGNNRVSQLSDKMGGYAQNLWGSLMDGPNGWGNMGGSYSSGYGNPDDPRIGGHMANMRGGQYNLLSDYAKQAANAGVAASRGGMGVQGGMARDAAGRLDAMKAAAGGYEGRYKTALEATHATQSAIDAQRSAAASLLGNMFSNQTQAELGAGRLGTDLYGLQANTALGAGRLGVDLAGLQYKGLEGQNAWDLPLLMQRAQDYRTDQQNQMNWDQNEWKRQMEYKNAQQALNDAQLQRDQAAYMDQLRKNFSYPNPSRGGALPPWMGDYNYYSAHQNLPTTQGKGTVMFPELGSNIPEYNTGLGALKPSRW